MTYQGVTFRRSEAVASPFAAQRGGRTGITITGATLYIRGWLKKCGMVGKRDWGRGVRRGEMKLDDAAEVLMSAGGPGWVTYQDAEISRASVIAYAQANGIVNITIKIVKAYIRSVIKRRKYGRE